MTGDPRFDWYDWHGGREAVLRFGPDARPVVIAALPLFEEANRTRAFVVAILRALAARGIGSVLPDVPGQGESAVPPETLSLPDMRTAFAAAVERACAAGRRGYVVAVRSGALLDDAAAVSGRWHLAPQDGHALLRELARVQRADPDGDPARWGRWHEDDTPVAIGGNRIAPAFLRDLGQASAHGPDRTVRLTSDGASADLTLDGPALWRRSEPGNDPAFAGALADDIARWIAICEG